jgi:cellulose synthase/poly-beta-1,6-N-acetylglucosamine synthase-like glycosyltransferase
MLVILFWLIILSFGLIWFGYPLFLFIFTLVKKRTKKINRLNINFSKITLLVTAYNESEWIEEKVRNSLELNYPPDLLLLYWVIDGSTDDSYVKLKSFPSIKVFYETKRLGKIAAINRVMPFVNTEIVIFSDANTLIGKNSIQRIVELFLDQKVGCVSGEKRIFYKNMDGASGAGEGFYWRFESWVKKLESEIGSVIGAPGELFAIRKELFEPPPEDTILDDFFISLGIARKGYKIAYHPEAYSIENPSVSVKEEMKRKSRISAGDFQTFVRMPDLLNPFKFGFLSFQYWFHKVLRWTLSPILLFIVLPVNIAIIISEYKNLLFLLFFIFQLIFYLMVLWGFLNQNKKIKNQFLFVPYYFLSSNLSFYKGFWRSITKSQSVTWEKAFRELPRKE